MHNRVPRPPASECVHQWTEHAPRVRTLGHDQRARAAIGSGQQRSYEDVDRLVVDEWARDPDAVPGTADQTDHGLPRRARDPGGQRERGGLADDRLPSRVWRRSAVPEDPNSPPSSLALEP